MNERTLAPSRRWVLPAALLASLVLIAPAFTSPRYVDDFYIQARIRGTLGAPTTYGAYDFFSTEAQVRDFIRRGVLPWWTDPRLELRLLRPLTSATHAADIAVHGGRPLLCRLHSALWLGALCVAAWALFRRWLSRDAAALATFLYAIAGHHALSAAWISARHALVSGAFGAVALWAWLRFREDRSRASAALWLSATLLGLCAGEVGLGAPILCAAHALFARRDHGFRQRVIEALPALGVAVLYLAVYAVLGYGARNSAAYVDPITSPLEFVRIGAGRWLAMAAQLVLGIPAEFYIAVEARPMLSVAGVLGAIVIAFAARRAGQSELRTSPGWLVIGGALALVPAGAAVPGGRALPLAALGFTAIIAAAIADGVVRWRAGRRPGAVLLAALGVLAFGQIVIAASSRWVLAASMREGAEKQAEITRRWSAPCAPDQLRVILAAPDFAVGAYAPLQLSELRAEPLEQFRLASMAPIDITITRNAERALRLEAASGKAFFQSQWEQVHSPRSPVLDQRGDYDGVSVRVSAIDGAGRPTALELETASDFASVCWLRWHDGTFERTSVPSPGESMVIAAEPGPLALPTERR